MSSDRERIIEFDASTSIPADGWFAIDSTTEGTRKVQKSAIIGSGSLDTTSQEVVGAINEVNQRAATIDSMTQDEYDDLPSTKESDNVPRFITDGVPTFDETLWNKVGTDPLDTTAQDCSGAINEINQSLSQLNVTEDYNFDEGSLANNSFKRISINIAKTGYTPIGIVKIHQTGTGYPWIYLSEFFIEGTTAYATFANPSNATGYTLKGYITVSYTKTFS